MAPTKQENTPALFDGERSYTDKNEETNIGPMPGQKAPGFETTGYINGQFLQFRLDDYTGKWVLLVFYPLDYDCIAPSELLTIQDFVPELESNNCSVLAISSSGVTNKEIWVQTCPCQAGVAGLTSQARSGPRTPRGAPMCKAAS